jgi:cellulose biosynthesis protein BcsQ
MTMTAHLSDLRRRAIDVLINALKTEENLEKAVLAQDPQGLLRVTLWLRPGADEDAARTRVVDAIAAPDRFSPEDVWVRTDAMSRADSIVHDATWDEGIPVPGVDKLRIDERVRTRTAWLPHLRQPTWEAVHPLLRAAAGEEVSEGGPPIVVFYSFKGGVGRTTSLASFAIQRARAGERVVVIDFDLDAPGAGTLLYSETGDSPYGTVDYLLEAPLGEVKVEQYLHHCPSERFLGGETKADGGVRRTDRGAIIGEIVVMPAGRVDEDYLGKLSRLDLEVRGDEHPLHSLLLQVKDNLRPDWILIDSRAGLSPAAGLLLDGIAHLHVLFGTTSAQSQLGLTQVIRRLGKDRVLRELEQMTCLVVQAMIPQNLEVEKAARRQFDDWLEQTLMHHYIASGEEDPNGKFWTVHDLEGKESPSRAVGITYNPALAFFSKIDDVAGELMTERYLELGKRIVGQFEITEDEHDDVPEPYV